MKFIYLGGLAVAFLGCGLSNAEIIKEKLGSDEIEIPIPSDYYRFDGKSEVIDTYYSGLTNINRIVAMFCSQQDLISVLNDSMPPLERSYTVQVAKAHENVKISDFNFSSIKRDVEENLTLLVEDPQGITKDLGEKSSSGFSELLGKQIDSKVSGITNLGFFDKNADSICILSIGKVKVAEQGGDVLVDRINVVALCVLNLGGKVVNLSCVAQYRDEEDMKWAKAEIRKWRDEFIVANHKESSPVISANRNISGKTHSDGLASYNIGSALGRAFGWIIIIIIIAGIIFVGKCVAKSVRKG